MRAHTGRDLVILRCKKGCGEGEPLTACPRGSWLPGLAPGARRWPVSTCSALDIHGGGLICASHHENERAQADRGRR